MRSRNGVSTPIVGSRRAWTEAKTQHQDSLGIWHAENAVEICVDTGLNTQIETIRTSSGTTRTMLEREDEDEVCVPNTSKLKVDTIHERNNGFEGFGFTVTYTITARGSATATINATDFANTVNDFAKTY